MVQAVAAERVRRLPGRLITATAVVVIGLLAVFLAWTAEGHVQVRSTRFLADHAIRKLEARLLAGVTADDLDGQSAGEASPLYQHLSHLLERARDDDERSLLQANIYAPDGTVIFSGQPDRVGRKVLPSRVPRLAGALAGTINTRLLLLSHVDDEELTRRYTEVLAVYSPVIRNGEVVAAAEVYADLTPIRLVRLATWVIIVGPVTLGLLLYVRRRQAEQADQVERLIVEAFFDSLTGLANRALFRFRLQQACDLRTPCRGWPATSSRSCSKKSPALTMPAPSHSASSTRCGNRSSWPARSVSCGSASGSPRGASSINEPEDVLHDADLALYQAKEGGRDQYAVFNPATARHISKAS